MSTNIKKSVQVQVQIQLGHCHIQIYLVLFLFICTCIVQIKCTFILWGALIKLVIIFFSDSMHWTIEPPVRASSRGRAVQREGHIRLHLLFIRSYFQFYCYLLIIALFSLF